MEHPHEHPEAAATETSDVDLALAHHDADEAVLVLSPITERSIVAMAPVLAELDR